MFLSSRCIPAKASGGVMQKTTLSLLDHRELCRNSVKTNKSTLPLPGSCTLRKTQSSHEIKPLCQRTNKDATKALFLLITLRVFLSQVSTVSPLIGLYIDKPTLRVSHCIQFFTAYAAVSGSFSHSTCSIL